MQQINISVDIFVTQVFITNFMLSTKGENAVLFVSKFYYFHSIF